LVNKDRLVTEFVQLVAMDSPSFEEMEVGTYVKEQLRALGFEIREDEAGRKNHGSCGNIYGFLKGTKELEPILFCVHMDTVEPARGKTAVIAEDGTITSKGNTVLGADDFAGITAILEALRVVQENNLAHRPIEVLFTTAEEVYSKGIAHFDYSWLKSKEGYTLDLTGPVGMAAYKAPSILAMEIQIKGKAAHAGFAPEEGVHAIAVAAKAISELKLGHIDEETTQNIGIIHGGLMSNIVPESCSIKGEVRSYDHEKAVRETEKTKAVFERFAKEYKAGLEFTVTIGCKAYETPIDDPVVKRFEEACGQLDLPCRMIETFGGSDNNVLATYGFRGIVLATAMNQCHSVKEYTSVNELCKIAEVTVRLMTSDR